MQERDLGQGTYTPTDGLQGNFDAGQIGSGDQGVLRLTFPFPVTFVPLDAVNGALGWVFDRAGQHLIGVDFEGDSTLKIVWQAG